MAELFANINVQRDNFTLAADFHLPSDGITALFGPSGCGKSTIMRALAGLQTNAETQQGTIYLEHRGEALFWLSPQQKAVPAWQRNIGFVFQQPGLFPHLTVAQNIAFAWQRVPASEQRKRALFAPAAIAELCGVSALLQRTPEQLSGGQQQRVAIARALASCPQVLLLDEPLANLDAAAKASFIALLKRIHKAVKIPILYVSHQLDEVVQLADYLLLMEHGKLVAQGEIATVLQSNIGFARCAGENILQGNVSEIPVAANGLLQINVAGQQVSFPDPRLMLAINEGGTAVTSEAQSAPVTDEFVSGSRCRIHVRARELCIATELHSASSIHNSISAKIMSFHNTQHPAELRVCLAITEAENDTEQSNIERPAQLVSAIITRSSADRLQLTEQQGVYLQMKAVALSY